MPFRLHIATDPWEKLYVPGANSARSGDSGSAELPISAENQLIPLLGYANRFANHAAMIIPASASALAIANMTLDNPYASNRPAAPDPRA